MLNRLTFACAVAAFACAIPDAPLRAQAAAFADPAAIDAAVARFTGAAVGQPGGAALPVDRRLRLAACAAPLALSWRGVAQETVVVQCPGGWRLFVGLGGAGQPAAPVVAKGDALTIVVRGDGFSVSQGGEALEPGAVGAWIRVRAGETAPGTKADALRARVIRPSLVELVDE